MKLINVYIREVTRRLPEKMRDDISLELRSTILDMLPNDFSDHEVIETLKKLGNPAVLASNYADRPMQLIGPKVYDMYITVLKLAFSIVAIVAVVLFLVENLDIMFGSDEAPLVIGSTLLGEAIWLIMNTAIQVFFWVTIVFVIIDRTMKSPVDTPISYSGKQWTPKDLENIPYIPQKKEIKISEMLFALFMSVLFVIIYLNAAQIVGFYDKSLTGSKSIPVFNQETLMSYFPLVIIMVILEIIRVTYKFIVRQWTVNLAISNVLIHIASYIFIIVIASNPNLFHPDFVTYMANLVDKPLETVDVSIFRIKWVTVSIIVGMGLIDSYLGFKKARIK